MVGMTHVVRVVMHAPLNREIQAERRLREVLKKLGDAGETLRQRELDLEEATRQYLQLICDSQVGRGAQHSHAGNQHSHAGNLVA